MQKRFELPSRYNMALASRTILWRTKNAVRYASSNIKKEEMEEEIQKLRMTTKMTFEREMYSRSSIGTISEKYMIRKNLMKQEEHLHKLGVWQKFLE